MAKLCLLSLLTMIWLPAQAAEPARRELPPNSAKIQLRWIDVRGQVRQVGKVKRQQWTWSRFMSSDATDSPALRVWVESSLPADWKAQKVTGEGATLVEPYGSGRSQTLTIDLRATRSTLRFEFRDGKGKPAELTLTAHVALKRPYLLVHPDCADENVHALVNKATAQHLFNGLSCIDRGEIVDIHFFRSIDAKWNHSPGLVAFDDANRFVAFKYHLAKPEKPLHETRTLFRVGTLDERKRATEYTVYFKIEE